MDIQTDGYTDIQTDRTAVLSLLTKDKECRGPLRDYKSPLPGNLYDFTFQRQKMIFFLAENKIL